MFDSGRTQILVYIGVAAVLALVGINSLRGEGDSSPDFQGPTAAKASQKSGLKISADESNLVVDVSGGVKRPGVYEFPQGTRVIDAIKRAGGTVPSAVPGAINRAAELADGQQVVVPVAVAAGAGTGASAAAGLAGAADAPISLGSATAEQLEQIESIGPVTAAAIIEFRDSQGGVGSIDELDQVSGIGPVTMEALRSGLTP